MLYAGSRQLGEIVRKNGADETLYFHQDHLGSVELISNDDGETTRLTIGYDKEGAKETVGDFVKSYNALVDAIKSSGAKAVFTEAGFNPELAQAIADEAGVVVESDLYNDSLGDAPVDTYEGLMRWDTEKIVQALGGTVTPP